MSTTTQRIVNGFDTAGLQQLAGHLSENGDAGRVTFKTTSRWQDGARVLTRVGGYTVDGQALHPDRSFVLLADQPVEFTATDAAPGPMEQLMHALGSCVAAGANAAAALNDIELSHLEVTLESDLDLHGFFGLDETVRPGVQALRVRISIAGNADADTLEAMAMHGYRASPVRDTIEKGAMLVPEVTVGG